MTHNNTKQKAQGACDSKGLHTNTNSADSLSHGPIQQAPDGKATSASTPAITAQQDLTLTITTTAPRVDSRLLARQLGNRHKHVIALIDKYRKELERFAKVLFKKEPSAGKTGQFERFSLLTEDQAFFVLAVSRNSDAVVDLKLRLVQAFGNARRADGLRKTEYLPHYHALHDRLGTLAAGSSNERHVHMNVNKLLNKFAGIEAGQRANAALPQQALLIVGQMAAANQVQGATDHRDAYQRAKNSLQALTGVIALGGAQHG